MNNPALNIYIYIFVQHMFLFLLDKYSEMQIAVSLRKRMFNFMKFSRVTIFIILHSYQQHMRIPVALNPHRHLVSSGTVICYSSGGDRTGKQWDQMILTWRLLSDLQDIVHGKYPAITRHSINFSFLPWIWEKEGSGCWYQLRGSGRASGVGVKARQALTMG